MSKLVSIIGHGRLGQLLTEELVKQQVKVRVLARSPDKIKASLPQGVEVAEIDVASAPVERISEALRGSFAAVSTLQGDQSVIVDGQVKVLKAANAANVHRFISSTFSFNLLSIPRGLNVGADARLNFIDAAEERKGNVEVSHIFNGIFADLAIFAFIGFFDPKAEKFSYYGDGSSIVDMLTWRDTARYTAAVAIDDRKLPTFLSFLGDSVALGDLADHYNKGLGAQRATSTSAGSLKDLDTRLKNALQNERANFYAWGPLQYLLPISQGYGRLPRPSNSLYPNIRPQTFQESVKSGEFFKQ